MSDDGWTTLRAERRYRGCLLHVASLGEGTGYAWAVHLPGSDVPLSLPYEACTFVDACRRAVDAADRVLAEMESHRARG